MIDFPRLNELLCSSLQSTSSIVTALLAITVFSCLYFQTRTRDGQEEEEGGGGGGALEEAECSHPPFSTCTSAASRRRKGAQSAARVSAVPLQAEWKPLVLPALPGGMAAPAGPVKIRRTYKTEEIEMMCNEEEEEEEEAEQRKSRAPPPPPAPLVGVLSPDTADDDDDDDSGGGDDSDASSGSTRRPYFTAIGGGGCAGKKDDEGDVTAQLQTTVTTASFEDHDPCDVELWRPKQQQQQQQQQHRPAGGLFHAVLPHRQQAPTSSPPPPPPPVPFQSGHYKVQLEIWPADAPSAAQEVDPDCPVHSGGGGGCGASEMPRCSSSTCKNQISCIPRAMVERCCPERWCPGGGGRSGCCPEFCMPGKAIMASGCFPF